MLWTKTDIDAKTQRIRNILSLWCRLSIVICSVGYMSRFKWRKCGKKKITLYLLIFDDKINALIRNSSCTIPYTTIFNTSYSRQTGLVHVALHWCAFEFSRIEVVNSDHLCSPSSKRSKKAFLTDSKRQAAETQVFWQCVKAGSSASKSNRQYFKQ